MIIVSGGTKGGSGKTTIATNLAVMRATEGFRVLLIDADDQESATDFTALRNEVLDGNTGYTTVKLTGKHVRTEGLKLAENYDDVIIDAGGRDTISQRAAMSIADVLLIPVGPRSFDVWALQNVAELLAEVSTINDRLIAYGFINKADPSGEENTDTAELIKETDGIFYLDTPVGVRKAFGKAAAGGLSVTELKPVDQKASAEISKLFEHVFHIPSKQVVGA